MAESFRTFATIVNTSVVNIASLATPSVALIRMLSVCNTHSSSTAQASIQVVKSQNTATPVLLYSGLTFSASQTRLLLTEPLVLENGDLLQFATGDTAHFHVLTSMLETS
jgi:hypothetical protein